MCLVATRVAGETMIEVDENGDEYELKRFYIQGRQLKGDGSQSQCVVTRRKRSGRAAGSGSGSAASVSVSSQPLNVESLPAKEHREGGAVLQEVENSNRRYVALTGVHLKSPLPQGDVQNDDNDDDDEQENDDDDDSDDQSSTNQPNFVPAALALPLQSQSTAAHLNQGVSVVANAASHANVAEDAGIVVVQSHQPPKVNPDTHAVFELKPVQSDAAHQSAGVSFYPFVQPWEVVDQHEDDYDEDDYDEEDYDDFYYGGNGFYRDQPGFNGLGVFEEEIISEDQPISTVASWSTGGDDSDMQPVVNKRPNKNKKNKNKKNKNQKQKNKNQQQNKKRQQQKKRKQEVQDEEQPAKQKKKPQQQDKDQKRKQDKDQKKKKPEENQNQPEMEQLTPVDVIKKPVAMEESAVASSSASSNIAASSSTISSSSSGSNSSDKNKKKKKRPSSNSSSSSFSQRKTKKKKKQSSSSSISNSNKRRRPSSSIGSSSSSSSIGGYRRRRPQQQQLQQQRRRKTQQQQNRRRLQQQQKRRRQQQQERRRLRNKNRQFYGDEPIINCIYINKDPAPTTTTPRPFWNILGRQSDSKPSAESAVVSSEESQTDPVAQQAVLQAVRRNFGDFGGRKRTNLRFVS
ncbi:glutamic acid-rich protein [Drosophila yakuba]|uniref:Uncharacterized protein n=1 Tax=Drosophila yakuba TaxID=7245 RepID=B4Q045_DROYA|nr:glutamic acid-rich protein [Drosophila yakuba]EDX01197.2 uncharacterized protein Dyak_GE16353 [Drosophila yakuba]